MDIPKIVSIADKFLNPADAEQFRNSVYQLQQENIDFKMKFQECYAKLQELENWERTKAGYKEYKTPSDSIVYVKDKESTPDVFYCPVCFNKKSIIPLQAVPLNIAVESKASYKAFTGHKYCPSCEQLYLISGNPYQTNLVEAI